MVDQVAGIGLKGAKSVAFPTLESTSAVFEQASAEDAAIGKGNAAFDAIFQFRDSYLTAQLRHSLSSKSYALESQFAYVETALPSSVLSTIKALLKNLNKRVAQLPGPRLADFEPYAFRVRLLHPALELTPGDPDLEARVDWALVVYLRLARGTPTPGEHEFIDEPLANGALYHYPALKTAKVAAEHRLWALLDFVGAAPTVTATDPVFLDLLQVGFLPTKTLEAAITDILAPLQADTLQITPTLGLAGEIQKGESLSGYGAFDVYHVIATQEPDRVLCLCVDATVGSGGTGLGMVRPFLGTRRFAWYFSQPLLQAVVAMRWARKSTIREFTAQTSVPLQDPNDKAKTVYGKARVKWRWKKLVGAYVAHAPGSSGAVRLKSTGELTILELWNHEGDKVEPSDYPELFKTVNQGQAVDFELFEGGPSNVREAIAQLGFQLVQPLYRPTVKALSLTNVSGVLSGAVHGGVSRGDLATEGV